jgi:hypothetical protein
VRQTGDDGLDVELTEALPLDSDATAANRRLTVELTAQEQVLNALSGERATEPKVQENHDSTRLEGHRFLRPDPWPGEVSCGELVEGECHDSEVDPDATSSKRAEGEKVSDIGITAKLEAENRARNAPNRGAVEQKEVPGATEPEGYLPARPDPWPDEVSTREAEEDDPGAVFHQSALERKF